MRFNRFASGILIAVIAAFASCELQSDLFGVLLAKVGYTVTIQATGNGTVSPSGTFTTNQNPLPLSAVPQEGYELWEWSVEGGDATIDDTQSETPRVTLRSPSVIVYVSFNQCYLTVEATAGGMAVGSNFILPGQPNPIEADADLGYHFTGWGKVSGSGTVVFADPNSLVTTVRVTGGSATVQATFAADTTASLVEVFDVAHASATGAVAALSLVWSSAVTPINPDPGFELQRSPDGSSGWTTIASIATNSYTDGGLAPATRYYYRLRSTGPGLLPSPWSPVRSGMTLVWDGTYAYPTRIEIDPTARPAPPSGYALSPAGYPWLANAAYDKYAVLAGGFTVYTWSLDSAGTAFSLVVTYSSSGAVPSYVEIPGMRKIYTITVDPAGGTFSVFGYDDADNPMTFAGLVVG